MREPFTTCYHLSKEVRTMLYKIPAVTILSLILSSVFFGQTVTITNFELEKYRQQRLEAERELRENYEKLGFPSPDELERREAESAKQRDELAARLQAERLERERLAAAQSAAAAATSQDSGTVVVTGDQPYYPYYSGTFYGYYTRSGRRFFRPFRTGGRPILWRVSGGSVIYEPGGASSFVFSPNLSRPRPLFRSQSGAGRPRTPVRRNPLPRRPR